MDSANKVATNDTNINIATAQQGLTTGEPETTPMTNAKLADQLSPTLPIFPCYEAGEKMKAPYEGVMWKSARAGQVARVKKWWADHPGAMPGLHLGEAGLLVVDADPPDGIEAFEALCEQHGGVPECPMVETPSGGRHYYFRQRPGHKLVNGRGALPPKDRLRVDIRGDGGFVIAPDATREDGIYLPLGKDALAIIQSATDMPDWLFDLLTAKQVGNVDTPDLVPPPEPAPAQDFQPSQRVDGPTLTNTRPIDMSHPRLHAWVESAFEDEVRALATCAKGGRNEQLNRSAFAIYQLVAAGWIKDSTAHTALVEAADACGLIRDDGRKSVMDTIASGRRGGMRQPRGVPEEFFRDEAMADIDHLRTLSADLVNKDGQPPVSWDAPDLSALRTARRAPPAFNPEWLGPSLAHWCREQAKAACAPVDYVGCTLLGLIGGILANRRRPQAGAGWTEASTLFVALVGDPSSGKSPASSAVMSLVEPEEAHFMATYRESLAAYQMEKMEADAVLAAHKVAVRGAMKANAELEQAIPTRLPDDFREPIKPVLQRVVVRDATTEKLMALAGENAKGLVLHRDELAGLFASFGRYSGGGGSDRQFLLECYGGRSFTVDRVKNDEPILIPHLSIGIVGALQPDKAAELLKGADDGFVSRFLWCWPDPVQGFHITRERFDRRPAEQLVSRLVHLGMQANPPPQPNSPALIPLEEAALHELERFALEMKGREGKASPLMKSALGKVSCSRFCGHLDKIVSWNRRAENDKTDL